MDTSTAVTLILAIVALCGTLIGCTVKVSMWVADLKSSAEAILEEEIRYRRSVDARFERLEEKQSP